MSLTFNTGSSYKHLKARLVAIDPNTVEIPASGFVEVVVDENPPETLVGAAPMYASSPLVLITNVYLRNGDSTHSLSDGVQPGDSLSVSIANLTSSAKLIPAAAGEKVEILEFYTKEL